MSFTFSMKAGTFSTEPISASILRTASLAPPWAGTPQAGDAGGDAGEGVGARGAGEADGAGAGVLLVVGVEDKDAVHGALEHGADLVGLGGDGVHHVQEVGGVAEVVARVDERLADGVFVGPGGDGRELGDQAEGADASMLQVIDVEAVVIERR